MQEMKIASKKFFTTNWQKSTGSSAKLGLTLICLLIFAIVILLRGQENSLIGREAYSILRLAENPMMWDPLSYGGRFAAYSWGTPAALSMNPDLLAKILPPIFGLITFLMFWAVLKRLNTEPSKIKISMIMLMISPPFIFLFTTLNSYFIAITLALTGVYALLRGNRLATAAAFVIMPLFNLPITVISMLMLSIFAFFSKRKDLFLVVFVCTAIIATAYYLTLAKYAGSPEKILFAVEELGIKSQLQAIFSDLGGKFGLSAFGVILASLGIAYGWQQKYMKLDLFFSIAALTVLAIFTSHAIFFLNFFVAALAAHAFVNMMDRGWESQTLKMLAILVIISGLAFSSFTFVDRHANKEPSKEMLDALGILMEQPEGVAFSHYSRGFWLEHAGKKTVMDENFAFAPKPNERWQDSEKLFKTRSIDEAMEVINKYDISYIWLDRALRQQLWSDNEEGLQFLLEYSDKFKKLYISDEIQVWRVSK